MTHARAGSILVRYETALWSVLGALAYLARANTRLVYPDVLWLFLLLLAVSLCAAWAVRRRSQEDWPHAVCTTATFMVIAAIQSRSGGHESNLWVLYLLPIFSSALLMRGRELAWVALGAALCDAALYVSYDLAWNAGVGFELAVKTGVLWAAAGSTWALAEAERRARARSENQRAELAASGLARAATAHDLSTPLMVIHVLARMRLEQPDLDPELTTDFERIERAAAFCQKLASSILAEARGENGRERVVNLSTCLENALFLSEEVLRERKIQVRRDYADGDFQVRGRGQEFERLFLNLIANASKAMPDGGVLKVGISACRLAEGPGVEATVEDTGPGIPAALLPQLFSAFTTTGAQTGGTGLGLHLCRRTARGRGGDITASNRPGGGAVFRLRLPSAESQTPAAIV